MVVEDDETVKSRVMSAHVLAVIWTSSIWGSIAQIIAPRTKLDSQQLAIRASVELSDSDDDIQGEIEIEKAHHRLWVGRIPHCPGQVYELCFSGK